MKKIIFVIITSLVCSFTSYAQQEQKIGTDGFYIGMSKLDMLGELGKMGGFKLEDREEVESAYALHYAKFFTNNGINECLGYIFSIEKGFDTVFSVCKYYDAGSDKAFIEDMYNKRLADMIYAYGQPIVAGKNSSTWRIKGYRISLQWSAYSNGLITSYAINEDYEQVFYE